MICTQTNLSIKIKSSPPLSAGTSSTQHPPHAPPPKSTLFNGAPAQPLISLGVSALRTILRWAARLMPKILCGCGRSRLIWGWDSLGFLFVSFFLCYRHSLMRRGIGPHSDSRITLGIEPTLPAYSSTRRNQTMYPETSRGYCAPRRVFLPRPIPVA